MNNAPIRPNSPQDESSAGSILDDANFKILADTYLKSIELPDTKSPHKIILCPIGLVGAGKSTVIKPLSAQLSLVRVSGDEIRKLLKESGFNWTRTVEIAYVVIKHLLKQGYSIAIDSDCADKDVLKTIDAQALKHRYKVLYVHINPPEEFILNKLKNYKHTWLFKDADDAVHNYYRRKPLHEDLVLDYIYTFDTSQSNLDEQIQEAIAKIKEIRG